MSRSNGSSMARASRCTRPATRSRCFRETCARSRPPSPKSSRRYAACRRTELILDGEVIALRPDGTPGDVPADDAAIRPEAGRRAAAGGAAADAVLLRLPLRRRRSPDRRPAGGTLRDARRSWRLLRSCHACLRPTRRRGGALRRRHAAARPRRCDGEGAGVRLRRRPPRPALAEGQARAHARSRRPRRRMGPRPPDGMVEQPAPGRARSRPAKGSSCWARRSRA